MADGGRSQLVQAYNWIKEGKRQQAENLLISVLQSQPQNADAWWLMANALTDPQEQQEALEEVLKWRPGDEKARKMLARIAPPPPPPPVENSYDPFADLLEETPAKTSPAPSTRSVGQASSPFDDDPFGTVADVDDDPFAEIVETPRHKASTALVKPKTKQQEKARWNPWALGAIGCFGLLFLLCGGIYVAANQFGLQMGGLVNSAMEEMMADPTFAAAMADPTIIAAMQSGGYSFGAADTLPDSVTQRGSIRPGESLRASVGTFVDDSWTFQGNAGQSYTVEVTARDDMLDPMVAIYDHDNQLVAENDDIDFMDNTNSRVMFTVSGTAPYTIIVSAFGAGGSYELRVR